MQPVRLPRQRSTRPGPVSGASPTKHRRTRAEIDTIKSAMIDLLIVDSPMTVRQVFYRLVSKGIIGKTEAEYQRTVCRLLADMRLDGTIPFGHIADGTRWVRKPETYSSVEEALRRTARHYRRALWSSQPTYVEVWLEKEALAGVLVEETDTYDVPLLVTRGYPSLSYVYSAAETIASIGKPTQILYFGDHDPSGVDIPRKVLERLHEFAPEAEIELLRIAVVPDQIERFDLTTRPTKQTDSRSAGFVGGSVEVDAIEPAILRALCRDAIEARIDQRALAVVEEAELSERRILTSIAATMRAA